MLDLSTPGNKVLLASGASAVVVGLATLVDLISGYPFRGIVFFDVTFFISSLLVGFLACDAWRDLNRVRRYPRKHRRVAAEQIEAANRRSQAADFVREWPTSNPGILHSVIRSVPSRSAGWRTADTRNHQRKTSVSA